MSPQPTQIRTNNSTPIPRSKNKFSPKKTSLTFIPTRKKSALVIVKETRSGANRTWGLSPGHRDYAPGGSHPTANAFIVSTTLRAKLSRLEPVFSAATGRRKTSPNENWHTRNGNFPARHRNLGFCVFFFIQFRSIFWN